MSGKLSKPLQNLPNASSSDDEEEEVEDTVGNSSEEEEDKEEEDVSSRNKTMETPEVEKKEQVSDSESGSEEETDSEREMEPVKKDVESSSVIKKRPNENDACADAKRVKTVSGEEFDVKKEEFVSILDSVTRFGVDELVAKQGWANLSAEDKKILGEKWKVLQIEELKFYSQKSGFIYEVVTKMAEAFRPNS